MDAYEATRIVFSRIQSLDPENAAKIMGLLLIQDHGEKEMIRLAFGPEALVHSVILKARTELGLSSNSSTASSTPSPPSPTPFLSSNHPTSVSRQNSLSSPRVLGGAAGGGGVSLPTSLSIPSSWASPIFSDFQNPEDLISPNSYRAQASNGIDSLAPGSNSSSFNSSSTASSSPFYGNDLMDDFQLQEQLSFLNDGSPTVGAKNPEVFYPQQQDLTYGGGVGNWGGVAGNGLHHRRSCSVNDACLSSDDPGSGFGWRPCLYFARGYCKNGTTCRFLHGGDSAAVVGSDPAAVVGSPNKFEMMEQCQQELLRSKSAQQHRLASASHQLIASSASGFPYSASKCVNFFLQQQQNDSQRAAAAAALMIGEDMHKFGRSRFERNDFSMNNPGSRQIYLTFPADSTFREEDVSNYFSIYGPVQDVRIPYQQKRMFGFVTFVYPETVKIILAKGNPHFVCDARVLVKPYKEKGKVPDKKQQQQQVERGDQFSACSTPTGLDSPRDPFDLQLGARMFYNSQDMLWRRKLEEQADLQQAIELQGRRLMSLQLLDVKKSHNLQHHRTLSSPIQSPTPHSPSLFTPQSLILPSDRVSPEAPHENCSSPAVISTTAPATALEKEPGGNGVESGPREETDLQESLEHNLPDSPFASPTKAVSSECVSAFSMATSEAEKSNAAVSPPAAAANNDPIASSLLLASSTLDMASFKSCYFPMPRFSPSHGAIGM
ncbi:zinc finger CCCH domain-containing protein 53-like isoform X2 [Malania oleifera]|uniref:zinc finger CCCH domain-containing protein 53-like isoform X2 n=1 Tax=Malania oleifera TaxID=397392 RepID=UPI0025ADE3DC|nr:zinc finger CCCH domain-containing protein 53-like isoform X2 [Malania oleifera]